MKESLPDVEIETSTDTKEYKVFYGDSEEMVKSMAVQYMSSEVNDLSNIERPNISFKYILCGFILPMLIMTAMIVLAALSIIPLWSTVITCLFVFIFFLKYTVILLVLIYQRFAPVEIRLSCRFEPSCSNYMLLAIKKYGFWKGFIKGIKRLKRCHHPNGGIDYP